jgi:endonuclease/exonuclease/phosphatase family metal-dependent hydrolase
VSLRVLTLNIWHDQKPWRERAARIREWLERLDPDVIALQEVLRGPGIDQLEELVGACGMHTEYGAAIELHARPGIAFGNAIASRWPIVARHPLPLPDRGDWEKRVAVSVEIEAPFARLWVSCTHLHWRFPHGSTRERQVMALADQVERLWPADGFPPLLLGDFNAEPDSDEIRYLKGLHSIGGRSVAFLDAWAVAGRGRHRPMTDEEPGITWCNRNPYARLEVEPDRRIDYVFAGLPRRDGVGRIETCRVVCNDEQAGVWPSDHFGVLAELRTEPFANGPERT